MNTTHSLATFGKLIYELRIDELWKGLAMVCSKVL
jgi:hypothetical protein